MSKDKIRSGTLPNLPNQRVSKAEKLTEDHYRPTVDYWITKALSQSNKQETITNLNAANGIVDDDTYDYVLRPLTYKVNGESIKIPGEFREIDIITPIKEKNIGEYVQLPYKYFVSVQNADATLIKEKHIREEFYGYLEQIIINLMNQQEETGIPSEELENIDAFIEKTKKAWFDDRAIQGQHILNGINQDNDFDVQRVQSFFYWWSTEQFYTHRYIEEDTIVKETISPLEGYPIDNGEQFIEDYDGFVIKRKITLSDAKRKYWDKLTKEEQKYLEHINDHLDNGIYNVTYAEITNILGRRLFTDDGKEVTKITDSEFIRDNQIEEHIVYYKTENKHTVLTYIDDFGELNTREVEEDYTITEGDVKTEDIWVEEVYKAIRLAGEHCGIYLKPERELVQRYSKLGMVKLPVGGKRGLLLDNKINPVPRRLLVYQGLIRFFTLQQERAIARHKGNITVIPQSMLTSDELPVEKQYYYMYADGTLIYDDTEVDPTLVTQGFTIKENRGLESYIKGLEELKVSAKAEAWDISNMNEARYGQASPYSTVRNNEQNLFRARLGSELMISMFNKALEKDHISDLEYSKVAYLYGKTSSYIDSEKKEIKFEVDPNMHYESEYGVFVSNATSDDSKLNQYKELAFAAAQNGDFELAAKSIESDNPTELARFMDKFMEERREFEQSQVQQTQQIAQDTIESAAADKEADRQNELDKIELKEILQLERELAVKELEIAADNPEAKQQLEQEKHKLEVRKQAFAEKHPPKQTSNKK